jgi:hypothetical protein
MEAEDALNALIPGVGGVTPSYPGEKIDFLSKILFLEVGENAGSAAISCN